MFRKLIATSQSWFPLPLRLTMGLLFTFHGMEKVFGIRGGPGLSAWVANESAASGLRPAWLWLGAAALFEFTGGLFVLLGLMTRLGALMLIPIMLVAIYSNVSGAGLGAISLSKLGYPLVMLGAAIAVFISGGGRASVDATFGKPRRK